MINHFIKIKVLLFTLSDDKCGPFLLVIYQSIFYSSIDKLVYHIYIKLQIESFYSRYVNGITNL